MSFFLTLNNQTKLHIMIIKKISYEVVTVFAVDQRYHILIDFFFSLFMFFIYCFLGFTLSVNIELPI